MCAVNKVKIGTRGSPLALKQTQIVCEYLAKNYPDLEMETIIIKTSGDWDPSHGEVRLNEAEGGKGLFAKEIEAALLNKDIDIAVHSMKDMDSHIPKGLVINHMLSREDVRDAFLSVKAENIDDLPQGACVGTASVRRQAFLLEKRPDLKIVPMRGNVQTRIDKLKAGQVDATFLACAGLNRLGLSHEITCVVSMDDMLPAAGQGAVGIEMREGEAEIAALLDTISCDQTVWSVSAERAALKELDGSCRSPIGAHAFLKKGDIMALRLKISNLNGTQSFTKEAEREVHDVQSAEHFGHELAVALKQNMPDNFLS